MREGIINSNLEKKKLTAIIFLKVVFGKPKCLDGQLNMQGNRQVWETGLSKSILSKQQSL